MFKCIICLLLHLLSVAFCGTIQVEWEERQKFSPLPEGADYMAERKNSEARIRANNKYNEKAYDRINIAVPKGKKDVIKAYAEARGESVNAFVNEAIDAALSGSVAQPDGDTILTPKALTQAHSAAEAAGETVEAFIERAVTTQAERDKIARGLAR